MSAPQTDKPARGKKKWLIILIVVAVVSVGAGAMAPLVVFRAAASEEKHEAPASDVGLTFGEVTVNLADGRLNRYLRVKIVLVTDAKHSKACEAALEQRKASLKNWLITHLSDKTLQDVTGRASINRIRREIHETFAGKLFPAGGDHLRDVLFEEFVVQ